MKTYEKLKKENASLVAERDALVAENAIFRSLLKMAQDEFIEAHSDGETDCITPYDLYHAGPSQCLREIQAEAGRAGFVAGTEFCADYLDTYYADIDFSKHADHYAERVKAGQA